VDLDPGKSTTLTITPHLSGLKQIVTAVGQGAVAANTIFEDLAKPYWKEGGKT
jgi:hypothetical protein